MIFDVTLAYLGLLEQQIVEAENFQEVFSPKNRIFDDMTSFMLEIKATR